MAVDHGPESTVFEEIVLKCAPSAKSEESVNNISSCCLGSHETEQSAGYKHDQKYFKDR